MIVLLRAVLLFEAIVVALAVPVAVNVSGDGGPAVAIALTAAALALIAAGTLRRRWGVWCGWLAQAAILAIALAIPAMIILGLVFTALWTWSVVLGRRIEAVQRPSDSPGRQPPSGPADA